MTSAAPTAGGGGGVNGLSPPLEGSYNNGDDGDEWDLEGRRVAAPFILAQQAKLEFRTEMDLSRNSSAEDIFLVSSPPYAKATSARLVAAVDNFGPINCKLSARDLHSPAQSTSVEVSRPITAAKPAGDEHENAGETEAESVSQKILPRDSSWDQSTHGSLGASEGATTDGSDHPQLEIQGRGSDDSDIDHVRDAFIHVFPKENSQGSETAPTKEEASVMGSEEQGFEVHHNGSRKEEEAQEQIASAYSLSQSTEPHCEDSGLLPPEDEGSPHPSGELRTEPHCEDNGLLPPADESFPQPTEEQQGSVELSSPSSSPSFPLPSRPTFSLPPGALEVEEDPSESELLGPESSQGSTLEEEWGLRFPYLDSTKEEKKIDLDAVSCLQESTLEETAEGGEGYEEEEVEFPHRSYRLDSDVSVFYPQPLEPEEITNPFSLEDRIRKARENQDMVMQWELEGREGMRVMRLPHYEIDRSTQSGSEDVTGSIPDSEEVAVQQQLEGSVRDLVRPGFLVAEIKERRKRGMDLLREGHTEDDDQEEGYVTKKTGAGEAVLLGALASGVNEPTWLLVRAVLLALVASLGLLLHAAIYSDNWFVVLNVVVLIAIAGGLILLLNWYISQIGLVTVEKQMAELNLIKGCRGVEEKLS